MNVAVALNESLLLPSILGWVYVLQTLLTAYDQRSSSPLGHHGLEARSLCKSDGHYCLFQHNCSENPVRPSSAIKLYLKIRFVITITMQDYFCKKQIAAVRIIMAGL